MPKRVALRHTIAWPLAALLLGGCGDPRTPTGFEGQPPRFEIVDAVHNSGNQHFFFLPPLVPAPNPTGLFDATLEPTVEICEWAGACSLPLLAEYTMTTGPGSETIRMVPEDEHYIVNWHTDLFGLDETKVYRITVRVGSRELGHADVDVVSSGKELRNVLTDEYIPLIDGRTLPIKFRIEEGALRPDGILIVRNREGLSHHYLNLWVMSPDGLEFTRITDGPCQDSWADWSPDRSRIAFRSLRASAAMPGCGGELESEIYVMNANGSEIIRLTNNPDWDTHPDWSPDGTQIAFTSRRGGAAEKDIYVMNADGSGLRRVTNIGTSGRLAWSPSWSPDGTKIAFSSKALSPYDDIFVLDASASEATPDKWTRLTSTDDSFIEGLPEWSPDGTKIVFMRQRRWYTDSEIWVMNADGSAATNLSNDPNRLDWGPHWSPDGLQIAWTKFTPTEQPGVWKNWHVWKMNADGSDQVQLTFGDWFYRAESWR